MKEHALFPEAGFPCINNAWIQKADYFRRQFENLLREVVEISNEQINSHILKSNELVTQFTILAKNSPKPFKESTKKPWDVYVRQNERLS